MDVCYIDWTQAWPKPGWYAVVSEVQDDRLATYTKTNMREPPGLV